MATGTIVFVKTIVEYGFIKEDGTPTGEMGEVFFHRDQIEKSDLYEDEVEEGDRVEFMTRQTPKGPMATTVKRL